MTIKRFILLALIGCSLGIAIALYAFQTADPEELTVQNIEVDGRIDGPSPAHSPAKVIKIELKALKNNTVKDEGIAKVFAFSSPSNRELTGPLQKFRQVVRSETYRDLLNFQSCKFSKLVMEDGVAKQIVEVVNKNGKKVQYLFILGKQTEAPYTNCWMTEGVIRLGGEERKEPKGTDV